MIETRRQSRIRKIEPVQTAHFDEQFWPVSLALCLTTATAAGAAVSLLDGPWMWATLLALPVLLVASLVALQRVRPGLLRRSLQLAAILSTAVHLLFLIVCGLTDVFGKSRPADQLVDKPPVSEQVMLVTKREANPIWREINRRETSDPKLEAEREATQTEPKPIQPAELAQARPTETAAVSQRNQSQAAQPRLDQSLGQLRRSEGEAAPSNAAPLAAVSATTPKRESAQPLEASAAASSPTRKAAEPNLSAEFQPAETRPTPAAEAVASTAARRESAGQAAAAERPLETTAAARTRDRAIEIPRTEIKPVEVAQSPAAALAAEPLPREQAGESGREAKTETSLRPASEQLPSPIAAARPELAQAERRQRDSTLPSISQESLQPDAPRRSNQAAELVASTRPVEAPSPALSTASGSTPAPQSSNTSLTKAETGSALAEAGRNLQVNDLRAAGVAAVASDSAARRRSERTADAPQLLNSQQAARERRTQSAEDQPQSAWKANTEASASRSGSASPSARTAEASASLATMAATSAERGRLNAEAGTSQLDLGPTKLADDTSAERVSGGGGATSLGPLNPEQESRNRSAAAAAASLATERIGMTEAPRSAPMQSRPSGDPKPSEAVASGARSATEAGTAGEPVQAAEIAVASTGVGELSGDVTRAAPAVSAAVAVSAEEAAQQQLGNTRTGISRAPVAQVEVTIGSAAGEAASGGRPEAVLANGSANSERGSESAIAAEMTDASSSAVGQAEMMAQRRAVSSRSGQLAADLPAEGASGRRSTSVPGPQIGVAAEAAAEEASSAGTGRAQVAEAELESSARRRGSAAKLEVEAELGPAGLGLRPDDALGSMSRPATRESESLVLSADSRFSRSDAGATPAAATDAVIAKEAFEARGAGEAGSEPATEVAIELGLEFLARHQRADGSWSLGGFDVGHPAKQGQFNSDTAATGLALLAFQGAGYTHREFKYAAQLQRAIDWLLERQAADGGLYLDADERSNQNCRMYSHAIATLALNEAYGMTQDSRLREPCQRALGYIAATQDEQGGWRYYAEPQLRQSDTSVTGWMMMALQSGRLAGLEVPEQTWQGIQQWLDVSRDPQRESLYRYNPFAEDSDGINRAAGRRPTVTMTSVGLLMRLYLGWERDDPRMLEGADYLLGGQMPGERTSVERDTYYWYYATQVLRHVGGERWEKWNERLHSLLVKTQLQSGELAGSWHPYEPVPDRWGPAAGRLYVTTMNLLSLEVNYRLLPLYEGYRTAERK